MNWETHSEVSGQLAAIARAFHEASEGAIAIDRAGRVTWINEKYAKLLGYDDADLVVGKAISSVIPETKLHEVALSGVPIMLDLMRFSERTFVVSRVPILNEEDEPVGAIGMVLFDNVEGLNPLIEKVRRLEREIESNRGEIMRLRKARYSLSSYLGVSEAVMALRRRARTYATRNSPVLVVGETGTGKELLAHGIHLASDRHDKPFVTVNVAGTSADHFEADFFGDGIGKKGNLILADGGTLFLDEISRMPEPAQVKLLRVLEDGLVPSQNSDHVKKIDVRIIATTSSDLEPLVAEGSFRRDLYYRLAVLPLYVPPLRTRTEDIEVLCGMIIDRLAGGGTALRISNEGMAFLREQAWPGNVRELHSLLERASLESESGELGLKELASTKVSPGRYLAPEEEIPPLAMSLKHAEKTALIDALLMCGGDREAAARRLGISRSSIYSKLKGLGVMLES